LGGTLGEVELDEAGVAMGEDGGGEKGDEG